MSFVDLEKNNLEKYGIYITLSNKRAMMAL